MAQKITLTLTPKQASGSKFYTAAVARQMGIKQSDIALLRIVKRSVDARRGALKVNLTLEAFLDFEPMPEPIHFDYPNVENGSHLIAAADFFEYRQVLNIVLDIYIIKNNVIRNF